MIKISLSPLSFEISRNLQVTLGVKEKEYRSQGRFCSVANLWLFRLTLKRSDERRRMLLPLSHEVTNQKDAERRRTGRL